MLCTISKAEEKHIAELRHHQLYQRSGKQPQNREVSEQEMSLQKNMRLPNTIPWKRYACGSIQYVAHRCPKGKQEQEDTVSGNSPQNNKGK